MNAAHLVAMIVGLGSVALVFLILAELSKRLGEVTRWAPYYRGLHIGSLLVMISLVGRLGMWDVDVSGHSSEAFGLPGILLCDGSLAVAMTLSAAVAWKYWRWLLKGD